MKLQPIFKAQKNKAAMVAAAEGNFDKAFAFVASGADINASRYFEGVDDQHGVEGNIGFAAIRQGNKAALEKALDLGLSVDLSSPYASPLVVYAIMQKQEDIAKLLVNKGANVSDFLVSDFFSPLALTRIYGMPELGKLIEARLSPTQLQAARAADLPVAVNKTSNSNGLNP